MPSLSIREITKHLGIGLTGGIATGKSTVARILEAQGELTIDADQLSRKVTAPGSAGLHAITRDFGPQVLDQGGALDRAALRSLILRDPAARQRLEAITHPLIEQALHQTLEDAFQKTGPQRFFYEAALLYERGRTADFCEIWVTYCEEDLQIERLMARDHVTAIVAKATLASQWPAAEKARLATRVIRTDGSLWDVETQVRQSLEALTLKMALDPSLPRVMSSFRGA
jgi:dephospho-CoA kinase